ncbi:hypothetical protein [Massilibacteroides sp.]|uniref:hypothetical protein n=1 Tax=Massilibacteroides sp. TaxID=2034766 RepID=UPI002601C6E6|nr:hypothetical protein [Massilibacteroides sp.]MDD4515666.1 hypothetical protein [Massilibacteroides sp.]
MSTKFKKWFYYFKNGHEFLLKEEADIIIQVRFSLYLKWMNDKQIKDTVRKLVKQMYKDKFPNAKRWSLVNLFK